MTTVFIVSVLGGQWEDAWEHPVKVVHTEERAQELVKELEEAEEEAREEAAEFIEKWRDSECLGGETTRYYDSAGRVYIEHGCPDGCKGCQLEHLRQRDDVWYLYKAVDMEEE